MQLPQKKWELDYAEFKNLDHNLSDGIWLDTKFKNKRKLLKLMN